MGNSQSTHAPCPGNPLCRALCWGSAPQPDEGEWFDDARRSKRKKKSRSQRHLSPMPVVPEESVCSDTIDIEPSEENGTLPGPYGDDTDLYVMDAAPNEDTQPLALERAKSESSSVVPRTKSSKKKKRSMSKREPKTKLTFVNGQFVDLSTEEGQELVAKANSSEAGSSAIRGIRTSFKPGHCGILGPSPPEHAREKSSASLNAFTVKTLGRLGSVSRRKSDTSVDSLTSVDSEYSALTQASLPSSADVKYAVSTIVGLGKGHFLTASKCDRVIKMWRVEDAGGKVDIEFVRDFVSHSVGITSLAKIDSKGRFLSASKDCCVKVWDSQFNCNDTDDEHENKVLLASFNGMDRRCIHSMAIIDGGSYVRPTDNIDMAMAAAMTKKAMKEGSSSVQKAARERQIIACSCAFATITGRHKNVKVWSITHIEQEEDQATKDGNVAEVKLEQDLKHDAVVDSIVAVSGKGILTGDRMGIVRLWHSVKNVFLPGSARIWACERAFSWRPKAQLSTVGETMQFAITSLAMLQDNTTFVSGSKSGNLRVWNVDGTKTNGETVTKEVVCITGAHSEAITAVQQGPQVGSGSGCLSFSSASEDGKVLSFALRDCNPCCFTAVNHGIVNRYVVDADPIGITALACLKMPSNAKQDLLVTSSSDGEVNILESPDSLEEDQQSDALVLYRQSMEEESLTLHTIARKMCDGDGIESKTRKQKMKTYKNCFLGSDAVSYLVENQWAASRKDAVDLGRVLATHLSLFECVTNKGRFLEDDAKSYYRFQDDRGGKLRKSKTAPNLDS